MRIHDLCLAWNWEYDNDFIMLLQEAFDRRGLSLLRAALHNVNDVTTALKSNDYGFNVFWNRATGSEAEFRELVRWAGAHGVYCINSHDKTILACDKAIMHYILINAGIHTPYTTILPSYDKHPVISPPDLTPLKTNFIIKPAYGGGGEGVVMNASTFDEINEARKEYPTDRYLVQANISPVNINGQPAWFRVIYCTGQTYPCWWNPETHIYKPVTPGEEIKYNLNTLRTIITTIANLTNLDIMSTEIAYTADEQFVVIDYVNDEIDLRLQSRAMDGVPDEIVRDVVDRVATLVATYR